MKSLVGRRKDFDNKYTYSSIKQDSNNDYERNEAV